MKRTLVTIILLLIITSLVYIVYRHGDSNPLDDVNNYVIYYRDIDGEILEDMKNYDLVIVEASHFTKKDVKEIKQDSDTLLMGYLSVMEIGNWDDEVMDKLQPSDYLTVDGQRVFARDYKNYVGDISQEHYRQVLLDTIKTRIMSKGMDGVFLDTTSWLDHYEDQKDLWNSLSIGYEALLKDIREIYPEIYIIQNRGFSIFSKVSYSYIDGIVWENFSAKEKEERNSVAERIITLEKFQREQGTIVFTISYEDEQINQEFTKKMNWKHLQQNESTKHNQWLFNK